MQLLDGKLAAQAIKEDLKLKTAALQEKGKRSPHLAAILVGTDGASETYVASKVKTCAEIGFESTLKRFPSTISEEELLREIEELNNNSDVDGILVQLPLPKHISDDKVINAIHPSKDVDGFHPINLGRMMRNLPCYIPATPYGILLMLQAYDIDTTGMHCVVVGRSNIVGSPMSVLMARNANPGNCTVTLTHSKTKDLKEQVLQADIIIAAIGKKNFDEKLEINIEEDELAKSLSTMRDELKKTDELDQQRTWLSESINLFIEETRNIQDNIEELLKTALINICRRNNFNQGAYFLYNETKDVLEMKVAYAFERQKYIYEEIPVGDGLIGQCFLEKKLIKLTDIPDGFFNITSGIGKALPKNVFIFPLIYEDKVIGVLELASFYILQDFEIEWLEKANEHISGIIFRSKAQEELKMLFEESKASQEKQKESEEQLRQNLEEIRATQEEMELREQQYLQKIKELEERLENLN